MKLKRTICPTNQLNYTAQTLNNSINSLPPSPMESKDNIKKKKHHPKPIQDSPSFKPSSEVKGLRFGAQFIIRSFTIRRASPSELPRLLSIPPPSPPFPSTAVFIPTNFTVLAHRAYHTLTLGLGTRNSKAVVFVFESETMKAAVDRLWPATIPLGDVNKKLIRGLNGCEMARFKFRKGCLTFYVYGVRRAGGVGFSRADELRRILEAVAGLKDFLDHTAMLALPPQRSITSRRYPSGVAHC